MADAPRLQAVMREHFPKDPGAKRDPGPFKSNLKCCTYQPYLPNFVVGELLKTGSPRLVEMFDFWLGSGALQPQGLILGGEITSEELAEGFGTSEELLCPFLDRKSSRCTIWAARPGVCSSYQCVSQKGSRGQEFWSEIEGFLNLFEWTLAHEVLWRMGWTEDDLERAEEIAGCYNDESVFLDHAGREREFYLQARDMALGISSDEMLALLTQARRGVADGSGSDGYDSVSSSGGNDENEFKTRLTRLVF